MTRKPTTTFNEYATQHYHQIIASSGDADRAEALAEAASQAALAVGRWCLPPDATQAAKAAILHYDDDQAKRSDRVIAALADGNVDTPTGYGSAEIKRTIARLGNGRRKLVGDLTAADLDYMTENRRTNHAKATAALISWEDDVSAVAPAILLHGTVSAALDAGEFRSPSEATRGFDIPDPGGKRIVAPKSKTA